MKAYVVMEVGWEYNDEVYYTTEDKAGKPSVVYKDKNKAEEVCRKCNIDKLLQEDLIHYCYDIDDVLEPGFEEYVKEINGEFFEDEGVLRLPNTRTPEQEMKLLSLINLRFFTVSEVEIGD